MMSKNEDLVCDWGGGYLLSICPNCLGKLKADGQLVTHSILGNVLFYQYQPHLGCLGCYKGPCWSAVGWSSLQAMAKTC